MIPTNWKRNISIFLGSQSISLFGSSLVQFAMTWYITMATQSGVYMTISIVCSLVPALFLSPFAGVWADRYDRKKLIMISDGIIALSTLVLACLFMAGIQPIWLLFVVQAIRGLGGAVQTPAVSAMIPDMVPEEQFTRVNGINGSVQSLISLASPALGGALLTAVGSIELIFFIDVVTAAIAIFIMLRFLKLPKRVPGTVASQQDSLGAMKEGVRYIKNHRYLIHMMLYTVIVCFMIAPVAFLTPLQVVRSYGEEVWKMTASQVAFSAGMLLGGLLITVWPGFKNRIYTMGMAIGIMGISTLLLGAGLPFWLYLALVGLNGATMPLFNTPAIVLLQERVDSAYMGRVFSVVSMINNGLMPLGMLLFGPLADSVSIELLLVITGAIVLVAAVTLMLDRTIKAVGLPKHAAVIPVRQGGTEGLSS